MKMQSKYFHLIHVELSRYDSSCVFCMCTCSCRSHTCRDHRLPSINSLPCFLRQGLSLTLSSPIPAADSRKHQDILFSAGVASLCVLISGFVFRFSGSRLMNSCLCDKHLTKKANLLSPNMCNLNIISNFCFPLSFIVLDGVLE